MTGNRHDPTPTPSLPVAPIAWALTLLGLVLTLFAVWVELPMWAVELGFASVSAGGAEYMLMLFVGLPASVVSVAVLAIAAARPAWRSRLGQGGLVVALLPLVGALAVIARDWR